MKIYNKTFFWIGVIIGNSGLYLEIRKNHSVLLIYALLLLGIILMYLGFKKPKEIKD
jgi:uncharacterized membrane protein YcaP (DUF421 family)